jgi:hypothetical protein
MENDDILSNLMKVYLAQMDSAMKISKTISEHGNEEELSADSIIAGLVYRSMTPMDNTEMVQSLSNANDIINDEYDTLNENEIDHQHEGDIVIISRKVRTNTCNCDICQRVRVCLLNYHLHEPNDKLSQIFKDAIDNACIIHKINI